MPDPSQNPSKPGFFPCFGALRSRCATRAGVALLLAFAGLGAASMSACSSMTAVDRDINKLLARRSGALGQDARVPAPVLRDPAAIRAERPAFEEQPPSVNPDADQIPFQDREPISAERRLERLDTYLDIPDDARVVDLSAVLLTAQRNAREYINAEEEYVLDVIRLLIERHRWGPRFFDDLEARFDAFNLDPRGGEYRVTGELINTLRVTQRLPYGGNVEAALITRAADELRNAATEDYVASSDIVLSANIPLLRGAGMVAREDLIQAERNVVYAARRFERFRREFFVDICTNYFDLLLQRQNIINQISRVESVRREQRRIQELAEAGRRSAFDVNNFRQSVLQGENSVLNAKEAYRVALDRFKVRIGVPLEEEIALAPLDITLPEPDITPTLAASLALRYRLDLQNRRDQIDDARRSVEVAKNQLLPDFELTGRANIPTQSDRRVAVSQFRTDEGDYSVAARFSLPLDRQIERLNLRAVTISLQRALRELETFIDNIVISARQAARDVDRAQFSILQQEESIRINELRIQELRLKIDTIQTQDLLTAENDLLESRNSRDRAIRDYRVAVLRYLLETDQLRVSEQGRFIPLQGMIVEGFGPDMAPPPARPPEPLPEMKVDEDVPDPEPAGPESPAPRASAG